MWFRLERVEMTGPELGHERDVFEMATYAFLWRDCVRDRLQLMLFMAVSKEFALQAD